MLRKALMLVFVLAGIAGCVGCGSTSSHYVYATVPAANQVFAYREDPNSGVLTELEGSPYSVGDGAHSVVIHPAGQFLYVANPGVGANGENDISLFNIGTNGTLTEVPPRTPLGNNASVPQILVMDPSGNYLYSMNAGSNNISVFLISAGGALSQIAGSPFSIGLSPLNMEVTPKGDFLYVTAVGETNGSIVGFGVNGGQLSLLGVTSSAGTNPYGLVIDPSGSYLYAANFGSNSISIFSINPSGSLTAVAGSPINSSGYSNPVAMIFDPSGQFLYVANQGSSNISAYSITNGLPTALSGIATSNAFDTEPSPSFMVADPNGKYLFVANQDSSPNVQPFSISSGVLTSLTFYGVGNTASSIAVSQ